MTLEKGYFYEKLIILEISYFYPHSTSVKWMHNVLYSRYYICLGVWFIFSFKLFLIIYKANITETEVFSYCMTCRKSSLMIFFLVLLQHEIKSCLGNNSKVPISFFMTQNKYLVPGTYVTYISQERCKVCRKVFISLQKKSMNAALCIHSRYPPELELFILDFVIKTKYIHTVKEYFDFKGLFQVIKSNKPWKIYIFSLRIGVF